MVAQPGDASHAHGQVSARHVFHEPVRKVRNIVDQCSPHWDVILPGRQFLCSAQKRNVHCFRARELSIFRARELLFFRVRYHTTCRVLNVMYATTMLVMRLRFSFINKFNTKVVENVMNATTDL